MVDKEKAAEDRTVAQMTMFAAQAHYRAAVCCLNDLDKQNIGIDHVYFIPLSVQLILHSIEHSLKLALLLEDISFEKDHNIYTLYKQVAEDGNNNLNLNRRIVRIFNQCADTNGFSRRKGIEIDLCVEKHRSSGAVTVTGWCQLRVASSFLL